MSTLALAPKTETLADIVADNIRAEAGRRRISRSAMARKIGMNRSAAGERWIGNTEWRLSELPLVAEALGVSVDDLLARPAGWCPQQDSNLQPTD